MGGAVMRRVPLVLIVLGVLLLTLLLARCMANNPPIVPTLATATTVTTTTPSTVTTPTTRATTTTRARPVRRATTTTEGDKPFTG